MKLDEQMKKLDEIFLMGGPRHFRQDGTPYEHFMDWAQDFEKTAERTLGRTYLWWGAEVSTVWLGLDHGFGKGPPLIFESMVFKPRRWGSNLDIDRYSTKAEALEGHKRLIRKWSNPFLLPWNLWKNR